MPFTDLSTTFSYRQLLIWQNMDQLAENDLLFNQRWTGHATLGLIPGPLRITNNVYVKWRNQANGADVDGIKLNASDQLELGANLVTPTLTADPTLALQATTKQYVDGLTVNLQTQPRISFGSDAGAGFQVALDTGAGVKGVLYGVKGRVSDWAGAPANKVRVTIDGTLIVSTDIAGTGPSNNYFALQPDGSYADAGRTDEGAVTEQINWGFSDRLKIEVDTGNKGGTFKIVYAKYI